MPAEPRDLRPLLLLFPARSGSTLLMQLLGTSPKIVFDRVSPFEYRHLAFLLRWSWQLADGGLRRDDWTTEHLVEQPAVAGNWIEPPPFALPVGFAATEPSPMWHDTFRCAWHEFSQRARRAEISSPDRDPDAVWYAEKSRALFRYSLQDVGIEPEVIYLLRDPRDILMSIWSFNQKRGTRYFSVIEGEAPEKFAYRFVEERKLRLRMILEMAPHDPHAIVVRYEDMATDLRGVAARLSDRYGVQLDAGKVLANQKEFSHHMSSAGPEASMQRWRREMSPEIQKMFTEIIGAELQALGYPT